MLSIIIPTYNEEKYITRLLDSILIQSFRNYEIIIVDADSKDCTLGVIDRFVEENEDRLKYLQIRLRKVKYRNVSRQKNLGYKISLGNVLLFIDADMLIPDENFFYRIMKKLKDKRYAGATCKIKIEGGRKIASGLLNSFMEFLNMIGFRSARGGVQFIKREAFEGFNEKVYVSEDVDLTRRLKGRIYFDAKSYVIESDRRYRHRGYFSVLFSWVLNGVWAFIFGRSFDKKWDAIR